MRVRVNPAGEKEFFDRGVLPFPEGTIVVKEKFLDGEFSAPKALGVMVKRRGRWEYFYRDQNGKIYQGKKELANCYSCHSVEKRKDQVFRTYLKK